MSRSFEDQYSVLLALPIEIQLDIINYLMRLPIHLDATPNCLVTDNRHPDDGKEEFEKRRSEAEGIAIKTKKNLRNPVDWDVYRTPRMAPPPYWSPMSDLHPAYKQRDVMQTRITPLASTFNFYRELILPFSFERVVLRNVVDSGLVINQIACSPRRDLVKKLHFIATAPADEKRYSLRSTPRYFPAEVRTVLSQLERFPNLTVVTIEFIFPIPHFRYRDTK